MTILCNPETAVLNDRTSKLSDAVKNELAEYVKEPNRKVSEVLQFWRKEKFTGRITRGFQTHWLSMSNLFSLAEDAGSHIAPLLDSYINSPIVRAHSEITDRVRAIERKQLHIVSYKSPAKDAIYSSRSSADIRKGCDLQQETRR